MNLLDLVMSVCDFIKTQIYPDNYEDLEEELFRQLNMLRKSAKKGIMAEPGALLTDLTITHDTLYVCIDGEFGEEEYTFPMEVIRSPNPSYEIQVRSLVDMIKTMDDKIADYTRLISDHREVRGRLQADLDLLLANNKSDGA